MKRLSEFLFQCWMAFDRWQYRRQIAREIKSLKQQAYYRAPRYFDGP